MLDRSRAGSSPRWMRAYAPLIAAAVALAIGVWLTVVGVDYARNGCDCDAAWYPEWIWVVMLAIAGVFFAAASAIAATQFRRRSNN